MDKVAKHLLVKHDIQKRAAARNTVTVNNAISENANTPAEGEALKAKAKEAVDKVVTRDTNLEIKHFNEKAQRRYETGVSEKDLLDPYSSAIGYRDATSETNRRPPFQEVGPNPRGQRGRGRGNRRAYRPYPTRRGRY